MDINLKDFIDEKKFKVEARYLDSSLDKYSGDFSEILKEFLVSEKDYGKNYFSVVQLKLIQKLFENLKPGAHAFITDMKLSEDDEYSSKKDYLSYRANVFTPFTPEFFKSLSSKENLAFKNFNDICFSRMLISKKTEDFNEEKHYEIVNSIALDKEAQENILRSQDLAKAMYMFYEPHMKELFKNLMKEYEKIDPYSCFYLLHLAKLYMFEKNHKKVLSTHKAASAADFLNQLR